MSKNNKLVVIVLPLLIPLLIGWGVWVSKNLVEYNCKVIEHTELKTEIEKLEDKLDSKFDKLYEKIENLIIGGK